MDQKSLLKRILDLKWIKRTDKILITCGGKEDDNISVELGFTNYLVTSAYPKLAGVKNYKQADAQRLPFLDASFDVVIVNAGLHHCDSPHLALTEMYRVSKKAVIVHEAQDSLLIRLLTKLKLVFDYETGHGEGHGGGLNDTDIPNFVYRWTTREVIKTINSYDPTKIHKIIFFRSLRFYPFYLNPDEYLSKNILFKYLGHRISVLLVNFAVSAVNLVAKNQGNDFAFIIRKNKSIYQRWIKQKKLNNLPGRFKNYSIKN